MPLRPALILALCAACAAAHGCIDSELIGRLCQTDCAPPASGPSPAGKGCDAGECAGAGGADSPTNDAGCIERSYVLTRKRLDVYLLLDNSASLLLSWPAILDGLSAFFDDPESRGIGVGLQLFGAACEPEAYATPRVPIAPLPNNATALRNALPPLPVESTSTLPALRGAITHARQWASTHPDTDTVVLLVTDALPAECDPVDYTQQLTQLAQDALQGTPSIRTFVVGIGAFEAATQIALAGGTDPITSATEAMKDRILEGLRSMRTNAQPCSYTWPEDLPNQPKTITYQTPQNEAQPLIQHPGPQDCQDQQQAYYLETNTTPNQLTTCPYTCQTLSTNTQLKLRTTCNAN